MLADVGVEFHGQQPGLKRIAGIKAGFQLFSIRGLVSDRVGSPFCLGVVHGPMPVQPKGGITRGLRAITICLCLRFNAS